MNFMLRLPNDALAVLPCRLRVWDAARPGAPEEAEGNAEEADTIRRSDARFEYARARGGPGAHLAVADAPRARHVRRRDVRRGEPSAVRVTGHVWVFLYMMCDTRLVP